MTHALKFNDCATLEDFEKLFPARQLPAGAEVTRIAPSPTGMPHIGTAMQAILDRALADQSNGVFILRIEDTDRARTVEGAYEAILDGLQWLQTVPDEGPDHGGAYGPYIQSERLHLYRIAAEYLVEQGHAYRCFCTAERLDEVRNQQIKAKKMPMYDRHCRNLDPEEVRRNIEAGKKYVIRMKVPDREKIVVQDAVRGAIEFQSGTLDDSVLLKSDGFPTYHLAAIVDDHFMRVTTVVRGEEWLPSAPKHLLLYRAFGWEAPRFLHTVLLRDAQKRKLSKRSGDTSLNWFRRQGFLQSGFTNFLTRIMWTHPEGKDVYPVEEFVRFMKAADLPSTGPVADMKLLEFINNAHISAKTPAELCAILEDYLDYLVTTGQTASSNIHAEGPAPIESDTQQTAHMLEEIRKDRAYTETILSIKPGRYSRLAEMIFDNLYFYDSTYRLPDAETLSRNATAEQVLLIVQQFTERYNGDAAQVQDIMKQIAKDNGLQDKQVFMTLRLAITGYEKTPPLPEILPVLGDARVRQRLQAVTEQARKQLAA